MRSNRLYYDRNPLSAADACGGDSVAAARAGQFVCEGDSRQKSTEFGVALLKEGRDAFLEIVTHGGIGDQHLLKIQLRIEEHRGL